VKGEKILLERRKGQVMVELVAGDISRDLLCLSYLFTYLEVCTQVSTMW